MNCTIAYDTKGDIMAIEEGDLIPSWWNSAWQHVVLTDTTTPIAQTVWDSGFVSQQYVVESGQVVINPKYSAIQLAQAKTQQIAAIEAGYQATLNAGFTSSANGTAAVYGYQQSDVQHMNMIASASALNVETWPINYADKAGQIVQLTQAQFASLVTTASQFNWAQINQLRSLVGQVESATTVSAVQAIVWTEASY